MTSYCNPLNIEYKYQHYGKSAHREAADPTLVLFKGKYYLFASMSGGFYYSDNLVDWQYHCNRNLSIYHYAPDVHVIDGKLLFTASSLFSKSVIYATDDPLSDNFTKISEPFAFWDPTFFQDDDGKVYLYWGCGNDNPIRAVELDRKSFMPIGKPKELIFANPYNIGYERPNYPGRTYVEPKVSALMRIISKLRGVKDDYPWIEGAFINKIGGKYYLQYAAPATQLESYSDGVYVGETPLGPFVHQPHNPYSSVPSGFIAGAGHGSTIEATNKQLWHASTMKISMNASFERRLGLWKAAVDEDGLLHCNQNFASYPIDVDESIDKTEPKWMLLSFKKKVSVSSFTKGYEPEKMLDEDITTCWCGQNTKETVTLDLGERYKVKAVQINFADVDVPVLKKSRKDCSGIDTNYRYVDTDSSLKTKYLLEGSCDNQNFCVIDDKTNSDADFSHPYIELTEGKKMRFLRLTIVDLPYGKKAAISGFRVFGKGNGEKPKKAKSVNIRLLDDQMTAVVAWDDATDCQGHNVRFGIASNKLYSSYLIYEKNTAVIPCLTKGTKYYFAVDAFNENGVTNGDIYKT